MINTSTLIKWFYNLAAVRAVGSIVLVSLAGCKEKYNLPPSLIDKNYLVVEGFISSGNDSTSITLTRTVTPDDTAYIKPERGATIHVTSDAGEYFLLTEQEAGVYKSAPLQLNPGIKYQLNILTSNGNQYISSPLTITSTPPVDSISWQQEANGVHFYVNTHDPLNQTRYYAWQFEETWEFYSYTSSSYQYNKADSSMEVRRNADSLYQCWQSEKSTSILIGSSAKLSSDVIHMAPINTVEQNSWKISSRYSILVKQRALNKETFEFLEKMKKNSEQLGTIFDPLPSSGGGNITCINNPSEIVLGQAYISSVTEKRIFINRSQLNNWRHFLSCFEDTISNSQTSLQNAFGAGSYIPIQAIRSNLGEILGYSASNRYCMDCRVRGLHQRPDFW